MQLLAESIIFVKAPSDRDSISANYFVQIRSIRVPQANWLHERGELCLFGQTNQRDVIYEARIFEIFVEDNLARTKFLRIRSGQINVIFAQMHKDASGNNSETNAAGIDTMASRHHSIRIDQCATALITLLPCIRMENCAMPWPFTFSRSESPCYQRQPIVLSCATRCYIRLRDCSLRKKYQK